MESPLVNPLTETTSGVILDYKLKLENVESLKEDVENKNVE